MKKRKIKRANKYVVKFVRHLEKTWRNKVVAIILIVLGLIPMLLFKEGTFSLVMFIAAIGLIFAKENYIE